MMPRQYGCKLGDRRPERFALARPAVAAHALPDAIEYRQIFGPVEDQGDFSTCAAHAAKSILDAVVRKHTGVDPSASWRAIYAITKWVFEPYDVTDDGLVIEDALTALQAFGFISSGVWSDDDVTPSNLLAPLPESLFASAKRLTAFKRVAISVDSIKRALVACGPLIIGVAWPIEWEQDVALDGTLPVDALTDAGGHCVVLTGYAKRDGVDYFHVRNSWGNEWGAHGYAWMPARALGRIANAYAVHLP